MTQEFTKDEIDLLFEAAHKERLVSIGGVAPAVCRNLTERGYLEEKELNPRTWIHTLTARGINALRATKIKAIQVNIPNQPPYILRNASEFSQDVLGGQIEDMLSNDLDERFGLNDGAQIFGVSVKEIDLWALANLPEWEPV